MPAKHSAAGGGAKLREARERLGLNQTDFGKRIGYSQNRISDWENGESEPSFIQCKRIALAVGRTYATVCSWWEPEEDVALDSAESPLQLSGVA